MNFIYKNRLFILLVFLAIVVCSMLSLPFVKTDNTLKGLQESNNQVQAFNNDISSIFGGETEILLVVSTPHVLSNIQTLKYLNSIQQFAVSVPYVQKKYVSSPITFLKSGYGLQFKLNKKQGNALDDSHQNALLTQKVSQILLTDGFMLKGLMSDNQKVFLFVLPFTNAVFSNQKQTNQIIHYLNTGIKKLNQKHYHITPTGYMYIQYLIPKYILKDLYTLTPIVAIVLFLLLLLFFRNFYLTILPLIITSATVLITFGIKVITTTPVSIAESGFPIMLFAIGCAETVHVVNDVLQLIKKGYRPKVAIFKTMRSLRAAILLTSLTTIVGTLSLATSNLHSIKMLGIFLAIGTLIVMILVLFVLPVLMFYLLNKNKKPAPIDLQEQSPVQRKHSSKTLAFEPSYHLVDSIVTKVGQWVIRLRWLIFIGMFILFVLSVYALFHSRVDNNQINYLKKSSPIYQQVEYLNKNLGGIDQFYVAFQAQSGHFGDDYALIQFEQKLTQNLNQRQNLDRFHLSGASSLADIISFANYRMHNNKNDLNVPNNPLVYKMLLSSLNENQAYQQNRHFFLSEDRKLSLLRIRETSSSSDNVKALAEYLDQFRKDLPSGYQMKYAGSYANYSTDNQIITDQVKNLLSSIIFVFILLSIIYRSALIGVILCIPTLLAVILNFTLMWLFHMSLNPATAIISAVGIGVGVDFSIHYISRLRKHYFITHNLRDSLIPSIVDSFRSIFFTAMSIALGFVVLVFSSYSIVLSIGMIVALTMLSTAILTLCLLPVLFYIFHPRLTSPLSIEKEKKDIID